MVTKDTANGETTNAYFGAFQDTASATFKSRCAVIALQKLSISGDGAMKRLRRLNVKTAKLRRKNAHLVTTARVLSILLVVVAGYDSISTDAALAAGHMEGNPLVRELQAHLGAWWSAPKILFHLMLGLLILWIPSRKMISMARVVVVGFFAIFINNAYFAGWLT